MVTHSIESAVASLRKITPEPLPVAGLRHAAAWFEGSLYLAVLQFDNTRRKERRRILRWREETGAWEEIHTATLSGEKDSEPAPESPGAQVSIRSDANGKLAFDFSSPRGTQSLALAAGGTVKPSPEPGTEARVVFAETEFAGQTYALAREPDGACQIVRRSGQSSWESLKAPGTGIPAALVVCHDRIYLACNNSRRGFFLWSSDDPAGKGWEPILEDGASRYLLNPDVQTLREFDRALYLISGVSDEDRSKDLEGLFQGGGFEMLRIYPDKTWDIVIGTPRFTPHGLKVPLSGHGAGFGERPPLRFLFLAAASRSLYMGTENLLGFQGWCSTEEDQWTPAWSGAFASYQQIKVKSAHETPSGPVLVTQVDGFDGSSFLEIWKSS